MQALLELSAQVSALSVSSSDDDIEEAAKSAARHLRAHPADTHAVLALIPKPLLNHAAFFARFPLTLWPELLLADLQARIAVWQGRSLLTSADGRTSR